MLLLILFSGYLLFVPLQIEYNISIKGKALTAESHWPHCLHPYPGPHPAYSHPFVLPYPVYLAEDGVC